MGGATASHVSEKFIEKQITGLANNFPEVFSAFGSAENVHLSVNGVIRLLSVVEIDQKFLFEHLYPWMAKQGLAYWYLETGKIFPPSGAVTCHLIPNAQFDDQSDFIDLLKQSKMIGRVHKKRSYSFEEQYAYEFSVSENLDCGTFLFHYHSSALAWVNVFEDGSNAQRFNKLPVFKTDGTNGIYAFSFPIVKPDR